MSAPELRGTRNHRPGRLASVTTLARTAGVAAALGVGLALAACGGASPVENAPGRAVATVSVAEAMLPTPTLAVPLSTGAAATPDPLRPPTPVVMPSATPATGAPAPPAADNAPVETAGEAQVPPPTVAPTPTVTLPPDATPLELLALGRQSVAEGNYPVAAASFRAAAEGRDELSEREWVEAELGAAVALFEDGQHEASAAALERVLSLPNPPATPLAGQLVAPVDLHDSAAFYLGRARHATGDYAGAIEALRAYAGNNPDMAAYVQPLIADAFLALGDADGAITALEAANAGAAQRFKVVENRMRLAALYLEQGNTAAAVAQYDAIHDLARTEATKGQMRYLAGQSELRAGNTAAAYERFQAAVNNYPRAADSYNALVALVDAGQPVDEYQRGVIDYYAGAYLPGIDALRRAIDAGAETMPKDAHLFLAWSYEKVGDLTGALAALDAYAAADPQRALFERAEMLHRAGRTDEALAAYDKFAADYPTASESPAARRAAALLADGAGRADAAERYVAFADAHPFDPNTPAALFRAAALTDDAGDTPAAVALWQRVAAQYPANEAGAEALFRLLRLAEADEAAGLDATALAAQVETLRPSNYFALRALDYVNGIAPFTADGALVPLDNAQDGRDEAEAWLRRQLVAEGLSPPAEMNALSPALAAEPGRIIGEKLWQLGLYEAAKAELETVREAYTGDPLANYQLALYFSELGLYRSSIIAAASLLTQQEATVFDAPRFLGRLAYPVHYADLILPLAERYGYDPRLQFALVRQESLFESIARSGAAAQGLSQVIPDTGAWIATRLAWPDFENQDLFQPWVGLNFGAYYLSEQLKNFDGHVQAALAAYNGGPGNAARWYDAAGSDYDAFVDTVDFPETRLYIERIYEGFSAYRHLYGGDGS